MLTHQEIALRGRIGAHEMHSRNDPRQITAAARKAFLSRFLDGIPADLPEAERERRATHLRKAYFTRLSYLSAVARRERAERRNGGAK